MNSEVRVEPPVLFQVTAVLRSSAESLDACGSTIPPITDAGEGQAIVCSLVARVTREAGQLVRGMLDLADTVDGVCSQYLATDVANGRGYSVGGDR